jgi:hypothetical protein
MAGLVPAIHAFLAGFGKEWMPGSWPGMTRSIDATVIVEPRPNIKPIG